MIIATDMLADFSLTLQVFANSLQNFQNRNKHFCWTQESISSIIMQHLLLAAVSSGAQMFKTFIDTTGRSTILSKIG